MQLTDTHIHLYSGEFSGDREVLMKEAFSKNILRFFIPNIDLSSMNTMFDICKQYSENCFPAAGLHPCSVKHNYQEELGLIQSRTKNEKIFAIGEIGMDLYWDKTFKQEQEYVFISQLEWAQQLNLPVIIHSRDATENIISIIEAHRELNPRGIFHCFSGNLLQAKKIISLGFFLGIGGVVTFKNSGLDKLVEQIDLNYIVLETDAPYLAPVPFRGKRNEPGFLYHIAEKIAAIKRVSVEEVAEVTTQNSKIIFGV